MVLALLLSWLVLVPQIALSQQAHVVQDRILVGTTSTLVMNARPLRVFLTLENISDIDMYCSLDGSPAQVRRGTLIYSNGGKTFWDVPPTVPRLAISCIHEGTGTKELLYTEQY